MGSIYAQIELIDRMSDPLYNIISAVTQMTSHMQNVDGAISRGFDTTEIDNVRRSIDLTSNQVDEFANKMNKTNVNPQLPPITQQQPPMQQLPQWDSVDTNIVFTSSGLDRFEQETNATNLSMERMIDNQQRISMLSGTMGGVPPDMITDLNAMNIKIDGLKSRITQINNTPIDDMGANAVNGDIERLNNQLRKSLSAQNDLTRAIDRMDVSAANTAYARLNSIIDSTDIHIRENMNVQNQFNQSVNKGTTAVSGMSNKIMSMVGAYVGIQSIGNIMNLSDSMSQTTARLTMTLDDGGSLEQLEQDIFASAQRSRASFMGTANMVAQLGQRAGEAFTSNDETIQFAENLNKSFVIAGASQAEVSSATLQLTQALGSGVLRGEELNAVFEAAPNVIQTIADYMGEPIGAIREMASEGLISADIVKNAMLSATGDINTTFDDMPVTFAQAWNNIQNVLLMTFTPFLNTIAQGATWIYDNWSTLEPIFYGVAAGALAAAIGFGFWTTATWIATGAASAFFTTLMSNPLFWIALAIGAVVGFIYKWVQSVGGIKVAWLITMNVLKSSWDVVCYGLTFGMYWVLNKFDEFMLGIDKVSTNVQNFMGDMKVGTLMILQNMVNGAIKLINDFISMVNNIPGVSIDAIAEVTFGTNASIENEANKAIRNAELENSVNAVNDKIYERVETLNDMKQANIEAKINRQTEIDILRDNALAEQIESNIEPAMTDPYSETIADNTGATADALEITAEDLKYLRDTAERETVNRYTTAEIKVDMINHNNVNSGMDLDGVVDKMVTGITEAVDIQTEGV